MANPNLLIIDDDPTIRQLLELKANHYGFHPITASGAKEGFTHLSEQLDVILLDIQMPEIDGFQALEILKKKGNLVPIIILSGKDEAEYAVKAVKLGAMDYICKPFDLDELFTKLRNAKKVSSIQKENNELRESLAPPSSSVDLIADSAATQSIMAKATKVASLDSTVLLTGESGTGKGVFARHIHAHSPRANKPFITVSCPALPRDLLESELFGHEKGAFTGAIKKRIGKIEAAQGGTLFLDEIGDLPIDLQPKLLNVLQDQEFSRVGGETVLNSNVRIIAATNIDFQEKIANREFREDLYYRLSVIPLQLPSLRERPEEILPLATHFLKRIAAARGTGSINISTEAQQALQAYHWPGNIRELENLIERASAFCDDNCVQEHDLTGSITAQNDTDTSMNGLAGRTLAEIEAQAILQTIKLCKGNKAESARRLGITEKSIYNKIKRLNITI